MSRSALVRLTVAISIADVDRDSETNVIVRTARHSSVPAPGRLGSLLAMPSRDAPAGSMLARRLFVVRRSGIADAVVGARPSGRR
jgi:hypothetical protein